MRRETWYIPSTTVTRSDSEVVDRFPAGLHSELALEILLRRYVHGPGVDEPLVWYEGIGTSDRRYLITDYQGSVIAENGATTTRYSYGPYGEPNSWTGSRFRYTGQAALPEVSLYHYKARVYDPVLGRFLQTDPVGYEDDLNLYQYVGNDPLNAIDPEGERRLEITFGARVVPGVGVGAAVKLRLDFPGGGNDNTALDFGGSVEVSGRAGLDAGIDASVDVGALMSDNSPTDRASDLRSIRLDASGGAATPVGGVGFTVEGPDLTAPNGEGNESSGDVSANLAEYRGRVGPRVGARVGGSVGITARFGGTIREVAGGQQSQAREPRRDPPPTGTRIRKRDPR